jgi:hypothetical protein
MFFCEARVNTLILLELKALNTSNVYVCRQPLQQNHSSECQDPDEVTFAKRMMGYGQTRCQANERWFPSRTNIFDLSTMCALTPHHWDKAGPAEDQARSATVTLINLGVDESLKGWDSRFEQLDQSYSVS